jgi:thiol-disulfide isomerase/thioredoxin
MFFPITSRDEFESCLAGNAAVLAYFSTAACSVCKVLKPKVAEMISQDFLLIKPVYVEIDRLPELAAQYRIFAVPTLLVFFDGRETIRKSRSFGLDELKEEIGRLYRIMF